jgi:hypothetical protein
LKELNLPSYSFRITGDEGSEMIFDPIRKKYVKLTPEEWVRQNFVQYLIQEGKYPPGLMIIEAHFYQNRLKKRADILIHDRTGKRLMLIECKSPDVDLTDNVFDQIICYNLELKVPYILVTNGLSNLACKLNPETSNYDQIDFIPHYEEL